MRSNKTEARDHLPPGTRSGRQQRWPARPQGKRWCWGPSLRCRPPAAPPVTDRPSQPLPPPLSAPRRKWQPKRLAGVGRRGRGGDGAQRPRAVEWRDRRGSHLKQGGSSTTSTRQEQDGSLSRDRERRRRPRRREWDPRDTSCPASLSPEQPILGSHIRTTKAKPLCASQ